MAETSNIHTALNPVQVSLLRLFSRPMSEDDTKKLKKVLLEHYSGLLEQEVTAVITQKGYTQKDFDEMLNEDDK